MANTSGGAWKRFSAEYGESLYIQVEIDGEKYAFYANKNKYKKEGDKRPDFNLVPAAKPAPKEERPTEPDDDSIPF